MARVAFHIPFHRMEVPSAGTYMPDPAWWAHRAAIFQKYTLPSLRAQTDQDFDIVASFRDVDAVETNPVFTLCRREGIHTLVRPYMTWQYPIAPNQHDWFCKRYRSAHWLLVAHLDSDDCWARGAVQCFRAQRPLEAGLMMWAGFGWAYGDRDGKMAWFGSNTGPPPFFVEAYPRAALQSVGAFAKYRAESRFECYHHQVTRVKRTMRLPDGLFMQVIHGRNSSLAWTNHWHARRVVRWIQSEHEKRDVLSTFGGNV